MSAQANPVCGYSLSKKGCLKCIRKHGILLMPQKHWKSMPKGLSWKYGITEKRHREISPRRRSHDHPTALVSYWFLALRARNPTNTSAIGCLNRKCTITLTSDCFWWEPRLINIHLGRLRHMRLNSWHSKIR